jgi:hypothetical protein
MWWFTTPQGLLIDRDGTFTASVEVARPTSRWVIPTARTFRPGYHQSTPVKELGRQPAGQDPEDSVRHEIASPNRRDPQENRRQSSPHRGPIKGPTK